VDKISIFFVKDNANFSFAGKKNVCTFVIMIFKTHIRRK